MVAFARPKRTPIVGYGATLYIDGKQVGGVEKLEITFNPSEPVAYPQMPPVTMYAKFCNAVFENLVKALGIPKSFFPGKDQP